MNKKYTIICQTCGKKHETIHKNTKFCSKSCIMKFRQPQGNENKIFKDGFDSRNAYLTGFIFSDGCLVLPKSPTRQRKITISSNDYDLIKDIHKYIDSNTRKIYQSNLNFTINIVDNDTIDFLISIGITPRKSLNIVFPIIPEEYMRDFIRGYFDGDGCIYNSITKNNNKEYYYQMISFTSGSLDFLEILKDELRNNNIESKIVKDSRDNHNSYYLKIYKQKHVGLFYNFIYSNLEENDFYLKRKKEKFSI